MIKTLTPIIAMFLIAILLIYAMSLGFDGLLLTGGAVVIAGLGGFVAPHRKPPEK